MGWGSTWAGASLCLRGEEFNPSSLDDLRRRAIGSERLWREGSGADYLASRNALIAASEGCSGPALASLSHANGQGVALVAMADWADVGVDIEPAEREISPRLEARLKNELAADSGLPSLQIWTMLEACVKANREPSVVADYRVVKQDSDRWRITCGAQEFWAWSEQAEGVVVSFAANAG